MSGETDQVRWRGVRPVEGISGIWPALNATRVHGAHYIAGVGTQVVYTVPANKKLYIANALITLKMTAAADAGGKFSVRDDGDVHKYHLLYVLQNTAGYQNVAFNLVPAAEAEAGWDVYVNSNAAVLTVFGMFHGWLEDA